MSYPIPANNNYNTPPVFQSSNLAFWYAADKLFGPNSTLPSNGATVNFWFDLSGNNNHLNKAANTFPLFATNVQNGLPGVDFSSVNTMGISPSGNINFNTSSFQIFTCVYPTVNNVKGFLFSDTAGNTNVAFSSNGATIQYAAPQTNVGSNVDNFNTGGFPASAQTVQFYQSLSAGIGQVWKGTNTSNVVVSATYNLAPIGMIWGNYSTKNQSWRGYILEVMGYNQILTTTQAAQVTAYLQNKWSTL